MTGGSPHPGTGERMDCQERRCTIELHGGDYRPISTPHRSGIQMKKKKKKSGRCEATV